MRGGKRPNAGRKSKAEEEKLMSKMDAVMAPNEVWEALAEKVTIEKDVVAIKLWLNYRYGMPAQAINMDGNLKSKILVQYTDSLYKDSSTSPGADKGTEGKEAV